MPWPPHGGQSAPREPPDESDGCEPPEPEAPEESREPESREPESREPEESREPAGARVAEPESREPELREPEEPEDPLEPDPPPPDEPDDALEPDLSAPEEPDGPPEPDLSEPDDPESADPPPPPPSDPRPERRRAPAAAASDPDLLLVEARRSTFAQPDPLKRIAGATNALRVGAPHTGHSVGPASCTPCITSTRWPLAQTYSYRGTGISGSLTVVRTVRGRGLAAEQPHPAFRAVEGAFVGAGKAAVRAHEAAPSSRGDRPVRLGARPSA